MTSRDRFGANLRCPKCGHTGEVKFSEAEGFAYLRGNRETTVEALSDGFKIVEEKTWLATVDIYCEKCDVSALPPKRDAKKT